MAYHEQDIWAARADGSQVKRLYRVEGSWVDPVLGWLDPQTYLTYSLDFTKPPAWPPFRLRTIDLQTGQSVLLHEAYFTQAAWDPIHHVALLGFAPDGWTEFPGDTPRGLQLLEANSGKVTVLSSDDVLEVRWSPELELFFAATDNGQFVIDPRTGELRPLAPPDGVFGLPVPSRSGELAWTGDGLWVGALSPAEAALPRQVLTRPTSYAAWAPDGSGLLFFTEGALAYAEQPALLPSLVAEMIEVPSQHFWVFP
jgi:hypothetical protein